MRNPTIPPTPIDGMFHRYCSPTRKPTELAPLAARDARWHRRHAPAHLHLADSPTVMWAELRKHIPPTVDPAQVIVRVAAIEVEDLGALDVTSAPGRETVDISLAQLVGDDYSPCQELADRAAACGYEGILAPSAALVGGRVLVVFGEFRHRLTVVDDSIAFPPVV